MSARESRKEINVRGAIRSCSLQVKSAFSSSRSEIKKEEPHTLDTALSLGASGAGGERMLVDGDCGLEDIVVQLVRFADSSCEKR